MSVKLEDVVRTCLGAWRAKLPGLEERLGSSHGVKALTATASVSYCRGAINALEDVLSIMAEEAVL